MTHDSPDSDNHSRTNWSDYKKFTNARIGLQRSGGSIGTQDLLRFRYDHAMAKDAIWSECDWSQIQTALIEWNPILTLSSLTKSREEYLLRPDLGRKLNEDSIAQLEIWKKSNSSSSYDVLFCVVDGLSPNAISKNIVGFLSTLRTELLDTFPSIAPLILIKNGRVAIGDTVAEILNSRIVVVLVGERPGLSSSDSIGAYITYNAKTGTTDESRNCISNIRPDGLSFERAKEKLIYLLKEASSKKLTGVNLKDRMVDGIEGQSTPILES